MIITELLIRGQIQDELNDKVYLSFFNDNTIVKAITSDDHIFWFVINNCVIQQLPDSPDKIW